MSTAALSVAPRSAATTRPLAVAALALSLGLTLVGWAFLALSFTAPVPSAWGFRGFPGIFAPVFGWIGYLLATRRPHNPIGWAFLGAGTLSAIQVAATEYASYALYGSGAGLPGGEIGAWLNEWIWLSLVMLALLPVFLYFPDGHLTSPRWRAVLWIGVVSVVVASAFFAVVPGPMQTFGILNPFGIDSDLTGRSTGAVGGRAAPVPALVAMVGFSISVIAAAASSVGRFRRARGDTRQQLKWFVAATVVVAIALVDSFVNPAKYAQVILIVSMTTVPIAIGVAILRYRLYEIDTLINRAIVYGALTAILAGLYTASIGLFQRLFVAVTGERSDAAIVLTTLVLASAFTPVKAWLQGAADRRFKAPADARRRLETFRESLRLVSEAVDGGALRRRFLEEAKSALGARCARLVFRRDEPMREETAGEWSGPASISCDLVDDGVTLGRIELGPRADGADYPPADLAELERTASVVARAYVLAERLALARTPGG